MVGIRERDRSAFYDDIDLLFEVMPTHDLEGAAKQMDGFVDYLRKLIEQRRADPGEDIMTGLIHAGEDGDSLADDEVLAMVFLLVTGDYQITPNLITNGVATLLTHPEQLSLLQQQPDNLVNGVVPQWFTRSCSSTRRRRRGRVRGDASTGKHGPTDHGISREQRRGQRRTAESLCTTTKIGHPIVASHVIPPINVNSPEADSSSLVRMAIRLQHLPLGPLVAALRPLGEPLW